jgi:SAM-dependent methyltransferase
MPELARRAGGHVIALDRVWEALRMQPRLARTGQVAADALRLPFRSATLDLVFSQVTLLWVAPLATAIAEAWRVLMPGGVLIALEPDYGGMMESPPEVSTRSLWLTGLQRAGADPYVGRKLPGVLARQGFRVNVSLFDTLFEAEATRFAFLRDLPLSEDERRQLEASERMAEASVGSWQQIAHLPLFLVRATKP